MANFTDVFGGSTIQSSDVQFASVALIVSITTAWPPYATGTIQPLARIMQVTASAPSLTISLPDATKAGAGQDVLFDNSGANTFTVLDFTGSSIATVAPGQVKYFYLSNAATQAGTWRVTLFGVGASSPDASQLSGAGVKAIGTSLNQSMPVVTVASSQAVDASFRGKDYVNIGGAATFTLGRANVIGNDFFFAVRNQGTGVLTISPTGGDLIDAVASIQLQINESCIIVAGTGTWYTLGRGRQTQFNFTQLSKTITGGTVTLTYAEASNVVQNYSGVLTSNCTVVLPAVVQVYFVTNSTSGAFTLTFQSPLPGSTFVLPANQAAVIFCDGTNVTNTNTTVSGITSLLLNAGTANTPTLALLAANNGLFAPSSSAVAVTAAGVEQIRWSNSQALSVDGATAFPAYSFQAEPGTGIYRTGTAILGFSTGSSSRMTLDGSGNLVPGVNATQNFGSVAFTWNNIYAAAINASSFIGPGTGLTGTAAGLTVGTATTATNATNATLSTTQAFGDNSTKIATTAFVASSGLTSALPGQTGSAGLEITTNGATAAWGVTAFGALAIFSYIGY